MNRWSRIARAGLAAAPLALLAGCGGGGGGAVNSTPTPTSSTNTATSTPPATTQPTQPVVNYDDAEYRRSNAAVDAGALAAYKSGASGKGVTIAVVDTGIATDSPEFSGRIAAASRAFGGNTSVTDTDGHGTIAAAIAAAARNGTDIEGIAWGSTILALRADTVDTCGAKDGCSFSDSTLTQAVDYARVNGAKVINLSLGGSAANGQLSAAIARATAAGIIVVIAAGNDGATNPDAFAQVAASQGSNGLVIIAGSHDGSGAISTFSDRAGTFGNVFLTALGEGVRAFNQKGEAIVASGTSFATPGIAAAVALLEQAFPNLTPAQVVDLLYKSATDAGDPGVDGVYGRGILNIAKAFQPIGTTSLAGGIVAVSANDATTLSGAMGDATVSPTSLGTAVVLDSYGRAFSMGLGARTLRMAAAHPLRDTLRSDLRTQTTDLGSLLVTSTLRQRFADEPWSGLALKGHGFSADRDRASSGAVLSRIGTRITSGFAFGEGGASLARRIDADAALPGSFLAAQAPDQAPGFVRGADVAMASRLTFGRLALLTDAERGRVDLPRLADPVRPAYTQMRMGAARAIGRLHLAAYAGMLVEDGTVLGARLGPALGNSGATTRFVDLNGRLDFGGGWSAAGSLRQGWTKAAGGGVLAGANLTSFAGAVGVTRERESNRLGLRFALPTRVTGGGLSLVVPTTYDYATGAVGYTSRFVGLAPRGRESDVEANAGVRLGGGWLESNLFWRRQPGNIAAAPDDLGAGLRYNLTF